MRIYNLFDQDMPEKPIARITSYGTRKTPRMWLRHQGERMVPREVAAHELYDWHVRCGRLTVKDSVN